MAPPRALVVDWGGVLTEPLEPSLRAWAELDGSTSTPTAT